MFWIIIYHLFISLVLIHLLLLRFSSLLFVLFRLLAFGPPCRLVYLTQMRTHDSPHLRTHRLHSSLNSPCYPKLKCAHMIRLICAHTNWVMMISFCSLLRLIDDVLITSLWTFIYMMISFCSLLPQVHATHTLCVLHSFMSTKDFTSFCQLKLHARMSWQLPTSFFMAADGRFIFWRVKVKVLNNVTSCRNHNDTCSAWKLACLRAVPVHGSESPNSASKAMDVKWDNKVQIVKQSGRVPFIHSFHSFIHSFIHSFFQPCKPRVQPRKPRAHPSFACTNEINSPRVHSREIPRVQTRLRPQGV